MHLCTSTKPSHIQVVHASPQSTAVTSKSLCRASRARVYSFASPNPRLKYASLSQDKTAIQAIPPTAAKTSPTRRYPLHLLLLIFMTVAGNVLLLARGAQGSTVATALRGGAAWCFVPWSCSTHHRTRLPVRPLRVRFRVEWACQTHADAHRIPPSSPTLLLSLLGAYLHTQGSSPAKSQGHT